MLLRWDVLYEERLQGEYGRLLREASAHFEGKVKVNDSGAGYCEYLRIMQQTANHITQEFKKTELYPVPSLGTAPEEYLSTQLQYNPAKTMAKYLDEYYWVLITHLKINEETNLQVPPEWNPEKRQPSL